MYGPLQQIAQLQRFLTFPTFFSDPKKNGDKNLRKNGLFIKNTVFFSTFCCCRLQYWENFLQKYHYMFLLRWIYCDPGESAHRGTHEGPSSNSYRSVHLGGEGRFKIRYGRRECFFFPAVMKNHKEKKKKSDNREKKHPSVFLVAQKGYGQFPSLFLFSVI